eukprot:7803454-Pyramimonas_sp.AAC.1
MRRRSASRRQLLPAMAASHSRCRSTAHRRTRSRCSSSKQRNSCGKRASARSPFLGLGMIMTMESSSCHGHITCCSQRRKRSARTCRPARGSRL